MARPQGPYTILGTPPRSSNPREIERWYQQIYAVLSGNPGIAWDVIDKAGSRLDEIETRGHDLLQDILQADEDSTSADLEKHISNLLAYEWERNRIRILTKSADFTAEIGTHHSIDCSGGNVTVTLPDATTNTGYPLWLHKADNSGFRIITTVKDILYQNSTMHLVSNGTDWVIS
jgi:hypothetical protein